MDKEYLKKAAKETIWYPFTQMRDYTASDPIIIERGEGVYLYDIDGKRYIDGNSSLWVNLHGHSVPELNDAIIQQVKKIEHATLLGLTSVPAVTLAERLLHVAPQHFSRVFYSDNGSTAVEVALKMSYQYHVHNGHPERTNFIKLKNSYHGDTLGAVSVGGCDIFHKTFRPLMFETLEAPSPYIYRHRYSDNPKRAIETLIQDFAAVVQEHADTISGCIVEPLIQGAGGFIIYPADYLHGIAKICRRYGIHLIFDEVFTGFGRTGKLFAEDIVQVQPDILACSKGITAGYMPLAVTFATEELYSAFLGRYEDFKTFFHGHSYTGNALACAVAVANLEYMENNAVLDHVQRRMLHLEKLMKPFWNLPYVGDVRTLGLLAAVELVTDRTTKTPPAPPSKIKYNIAEAAAQRGAIIRPNGNVVNIVPPLSITDEQLTELVSIMHDAIVTVMES